MREIVTKIVALCAVLYCAVLAPATVFAQAGQQTAQQAGRGEAGGATKAMADSVHTHAHREDKVRQRFNPIFGGNRELDRIIGFISSHLVLELDADHIARLDGVVVVGFTIDTLGNFADHRIRRSYTPGIDYAILGAMKSLPQWGVPSMRGDRKVEKQHQIVFSFGSYSDTGQYGYNGDQIQSDLIDKVAAQRDEHYANKRREHLRWSNFEDRNAKLEYDTEAGLRAEAERVDASALDPNLPPSTVIGPTIRISE